MSNETGRLRSISWRDLCPWLVIARAFRVSVSAQTLVLATLAMVATPAGWRFCENFLTDDDFRVASREVYVGGDDFSFLALQENLRRWPSQGGGAELADSSDLIAAHHNGMVRIISVFTDFVSPLCYLVGRPVSVTQAAYLTAGSLWTLLVWSLLGGAITRIAVVRLGPENRVGAMAALKFSARQLGGFFMAPLWPILGVLCMSIPIVILGLIMRFDIGAAVGGVLWIFVLLASLVMTIVLLGLLFGWPLMWGAMAAENKDAFDAISRAYACTFQRPLHYLFYVAVALVIGGLGWMLVGFFAEMVILVGESAGRLGAGADRWSEVAQGAGAGSSSRAVGGIMLGVWENVASAIAGSFRFSFFWSAIGVIYLLLRSDLYHRELDEVFLEGDQTPKDLPTLHDPASETKSKPDDPA